MGAVGSNSSFGQLQTEVMRRSTRRETIELDAKPLSEFLVVDVKKPPVDMVKRLADLFNELESRARRLSGANTIENI